MTVKQLGIWFVKVVSYLWKFKIYKQNPVFSLWKHHSAVAEQGVLQFCFSICLLICHTRKAPGQVTGCCTFLVFFCFLSLVLYSCLLFILQAQPPFSQPFSGTVWLSCSSRGWTDTSALELLCSFSCLQVHWVCNGDFPVHCLSYGWKVHVGNLCISCV